MKKLVVLFSLISGSAFAADGDYKLWGCNDEECVELQSGNVDEFEHEVPCEVTRSCEQTGPVTKWGSKKKSTAVSTVAGATGIARSVVGAGINGLKSAAVGAGYTHLTATLSGPSGHVTLRMNLQSSTWSVNISGGPQEGSGGPDHTKNIP